MPAATYNWDIDQGAKNVLNFTIATDAGVPIDTTGLSGRGQIRVAPGSSVLVGTLTVAVVDHALGQWRVTCLPAALDAYVFGSRRNAADRVICHYDVELYDAADVTDVTRWLQGEAKISVQVTI